MIYRRKELRNSEQEAESMTVSHTLLTGSYFSLLVLSWCTLMPGFSWGFLLGESGCSLYGWAGHPVLVARETYEVFTISVLGFGSC